jgi:transcriptional regulator with XRE-family HTH domain
MARALKTKNRSPEGCWIKYQMDLKNITLEAVAEKAGCTIASVSRSINGKQRTSKAREIIAEMLGYKTFLHLWREASIESGRISA